MRLANKIFVTLAALLFVALFVLFNLLPRSTFSQTERRELADFPTFDINKLLDGTFASEISAWYSDTEPYRDNFMTVNMLIKDKMGLKIPFSGQETLTFHASETQEEPEATEDISPDSIAAYVNRQNAAEENAKMAHAGILVVGTPPNARALMAFGATPKASEKFAELVNKYHHELGDNVNIYVMAIPNAIEFYCPDKAKSVTKPQSQVINHLYKCLLPGVKGVDCYTSLGEHANENIFLRTDHHWAPLGAYYAAEAFAKRAGVPFNDLSTYDEHVIHKFVGTMYGYSKDIAIKQSPEDFVYYTPTGVDYTTTFTVYNVDKDMHVIGEQRPYKGDFFAKFRDGSPMAYMTFMGGDMKITQVNTSTKNGRKLVILKDSFGNALPGYLFGSFEEIHVIDYRYFTHNIKKYITEHGITDVLFAHSIFMLLGSKPINNYNRFLIQDSTIKAKETSNSVKRPNAQVTQQDAVVEETPIIEGPTSIEATVDETSIEIEVPTPSNEE